MLNQIPLRPDVKTRKFIENSTHAGFYKCWTCGSCDGGCPINIVPNSLRPQKIVRLAYIGLLDELLALPEIWYCLTCRRCNRVCPNQIKIYDIINFARKETVNRHMITEGAVTRYKKFFGMFQRVRWHVVSCCLKGEPVNMSEEKWNQWLTTPVKPTTSKITHAGLTKSKILQNNAEKTNFRLCFTCGECSSACPIVYERSVFDPQAIIRMLNLGLEEELLASPSIWLCLGCERCSDACSQNVKGHQIIKDLQNLAISKGAVDSDFPHCLEQAEKLIYPRFFAEIDSIFGFNVNHSGTGN
jgi:heterodisulfide reductase subunit C